MHPNVDFVGGGSHEASSGTGEGRQGHATTETAVFVHALFDDFVDAEAGRGVGELAQERGRETVVESEHAWGEKWGYEFEKGATSRI